MPCEEIWNNADTISLDIRINPEFKKEGVSLIYYHRKELEKIKNILEAFLN